MYNFNIKMNTTPPPTHTHQKKKKKLAISYQVVAPLAFWYIFFQVCF